MPMVKSLQEASGKTSSAGPRARFSGIRGVVFYDCPWGRQVLRDAIRAQFPTFRLVEPESLGTESAAEMQPADLVLANAWKPGGPELSLAGCAPGARAFLCTAFDLPEYRDAARACGASHFVLGDDASVKSVLKAVGEALAAPGAQFAAKAAPAGEDEA